MAHPQRSVANCKLLLAALAKPAAANHITLVLAVRWLLAFSALWVVLGFGGPDARSAGEPGAAAITRVDAQSLGDLFGVVQADSVVQSAAPAPDADVALLPSVWRFRFSERSVVALPEPNTRYAHRWMTRYYADSQQPRGPPALFA